ncbi:sulfite exporter TauE/SafE family protein [Bailinhaonella thermotolerans]|uniref:sulfite exporter TauE/SafE family protein n=1 Tax=Bailinhaonella thermotolerans TaxID=1070861 RepID=UPI001F5B4A85|nr:sulfite exporter TauE/SafE family protein [Bailinhaonella thermotolerans]
MDASSTLALAVAGVAAGLSGSVAGLASLFSYPALLAAGLPPVVANVTNTVSLFGSTVGSVVGSRLELRGQLGRTLRLGALATAGGACGAALLLSTPPEAFEAVVPYLIALGSVVLLAREPIRRLAGRRASRAGAGRTPVPLMGAILLIGVYAGYFGAAAGVLLLAALAASSAEPLAVSNAVKNAVLGAANLVAALAYAFLAPVDWAAAAALAVGGLAGSRLGPVLFRRLPERPLRVGIALAGLALAVHLWLAAS